MKKFYYEIGEEAMVAERIENIFKKEITFFGNEIIKFNDGTHKKIKINNIDEFNKELIIL